jgi:hypothetical protein
MVNQAHGAFKETNACVTKKNQVGKTQAQKMHFFSSSQWLFEGKQ